MRISESIAVRISELLVQKNMTQYRLAKNMGIHPNTMAGIMHSKNNAANLKTIFLICHGLGVTPGEFFTNPLFEKTGLGAD